MSSSCLPCEMMRPSLKNNILSAFSIDESRCATMTRVRGAGVVHVIRDRPLAPRWVGGRRGRGEAGVDGEDALPTRPERGDEFGELRLAAGLLLFLHIRHAALVSRQDEPVRLDFRAIGDPDVAPMMLAPELLGEDFIQFGRQVEPARRRLDARDAPRGAVDLAAGEHAVGHVPAS